MTITRIDLRKTKVKYYYDQADDPELLSTVATFRDLHLALKSGEKVFIEFLDGDREGSIAELQLSSKFKNHDEPRVRTIYGYYQHDKTRYEPDCTIYGQLKFTGKSHRPDQDIRPGSHVVWIKGYKGPTVWKKFDAKAAKEEILATEDQCDRDGSPLAVGDHVIYVDLAYGSGARIERGTVKEFKVSVDSSRHTVYTLVENVDGHVMKTEKPEQLLLKVENAVWK